MMMMMMIIIIIIIIITIIHSEVRFTSPQPLTKPVLHGVRSNAS